jgi:hypothetical protein
MAASTHLKWLAPAIVCIFITIKNNLRGGPILNGKEAEVIFF